MNKLNEMVVRLSDGTIGFEDTMAALEKQVIALIKKEANGLEWISEAVGDLFDTHLGKTLPMPFVTNTVVQGLGVSPGEFQEALKSVGLYVRSCGQFQVSKGKGGGVTRIRDIPEKK